MFVGCSFSGSFRPQHADALHFCSLGGVGRTSELTKAGVLDVRPVHLRSLPELIATRRVPLDVVLVQLSPADEQGRHSLGLVADLQPAIATARTVVAEIRSDVGHRAGLAARARRDRRWPRCWTGRA